MVLENDAVFFGTSPGEGVGKPVGFSADPDWLGPVVVLDLMRGVEPRHPQPVVMGRSSVFDQEEAALRICVNANVLVNHLRPPYPGHQEVTKEFKIRDMKVVEVGRWGNGNVLVEAEMIGSDPRCSVMPSVGGGVQ